MTATSVRIKICGLTRLDEAVACLNAGADWLGLNFHPGSPRFISPARAREILAAANRPSCFVGLFVNRPAEEVRRTADDLGLEVVQLHGDEPAEDLLVLHRLQVVRAFRLGSPEHLQAMIDYLERARILGRMPDAVLVDGWAPGQAGGTGTLVAGNILDSLPPLARLILAGGLKPDNVAERVRLVRPWMVDVASGVESSPGRKDPAKVQSFIQAARGGPEATQETLGSL